MYGEEVAAADCCPMKQVAGDTFQLDHFNLTSSKEHSCKDGCIYRDMAGRHTCFTHGKEAAVCFSAAIREEEQGGCSGPVQLDGKQQHAVDSSHINWGPDNRVPYVADSPRLTEEDRAVFREAMDYIESLTCIRFVARQVEEPEEHYLEFDRACLQGEVYPGCDMCECFPGSYVDSTRGMANGRVRVITGTLLTPGNWEHRGHITHELLHTLGHHHTQNRADRDEHVTLDTANIADMGQYQKCEHCGLFGTEYDCMSIMHYRWNSLAVDPSSPTMEPKEEQCDLRSRNRYITWADMDLVNSNYECPVEYSGEQGVIQSHPTWPAQDYPDSYRKRWYLAVEDGHRIHVTWTHFKLEGAAGGASCVYDYAAVLDSSGELLPGNTGLLSCGAALPPSVTSLTNRLAIEIKTDGSVTSRGFRLEWTKVAAPEEPEGAGSSVTAPLATTGGPVLLAGEISSSRHPNNYPNNRAQEWVVEVPEGRSIELEWVALHLEESFMCSYDWVQVTEPSSGGGDDFLLPKTCGRSLPATLVSHGNKLLVSFVSDYSETRPGFLLRWRETEAPADTFLLLSQNYPRNYDNNLDTVQTITATEGRSVTIVFIDLGIEWSGTCGYDWVEVRDAVSGRVLVDRACGFEAPDPVTSDSHLVEVAFHSDASVPGRGFKIQWTAQMDEGRNG